MLFTELFLLCTKKDGLKNSIFTRYTGVRKAGETMMMSFSEWITEQLLKIQRFKIKDRELWRALLTYIHIKEICPDEL